MLVPISTTFLTGTVFLAFYTSVASASPAPASEAPANQHCGIMEWMLRECLPNVNRQAYRDKCWNENFQLNVTVTTSCPQDTQCMDILDGHLDKTIMCIPIVKSGQVDTKTSSGGQAGSSEVKEGRITPSMPMSHKMKVQGALHGSLSAILMCELKVLIHIAICANSNIISAEKDGPDLTPASAIIGKIHGKDFTVCKGNTSDPIESFKCYPTGLFDFNDGDQVDFTWSMKNAQKGSLKYFLSPA